MTGLNQAHLDDARQKLPGEALVFHNDASQPTAADELANRVAALGGLDGLWLNAGYARVAGIEDTRFEFFDRMMNANARGPMLQIASLTNLLKPGASVVLTSSTSAYEAAPMASVYAASKGALISMARCFAVALGERGIRVNVLVPGPIESSFRSFMLEPTRKEFEEGVVNRLALKRMGTASEAAAVALFLLSDDAAYVTGSQYAVDGGLMMR